MPTITEGKLRFTFADGWNVSKFDEWSFITEISFMQRCCGGVQEPVDILARRAKGMLLAGGDQGLSGT